MFLRQIVLACVGVALLCAQPAKQTPQQPPNQKRDLKVEKLEEEGAEAAGPKSSILIPPRSYALVVGVSKYKSLPAKNELPYAEADAQLMYSILISPEGGNFKAQNVHVLTNEKATLANLRKELNEWLPSVAKDDDRVLIYFATHGFVDRSTGKGYLAAYDIDPNKYGSTGLPMDELGQVIGTKIHARNKILLTDSCHSGAISPEDTESVNHTLMNLQKSLFSLTASRDRESSFEGAQWGGGHGVFTYFVAKGMGGEADNTPRDGVVSADELSEYVRTQVREATGAKQTPTSDKGSFDPDMFLALVPANAPPGVPPAAKFGTLVFESNMDDVTILIDKKVVGVVNKGTPLPFPGLTPGSHVIEGTHNGYEPDGPREETVYPGQKSTVSIKILIPRKRKQAAVDLLDKGLKDYLKGGQANYKRAAESFNQAFKMDSTYSQAAYYLARSYSAQFDQENAAKYFKKAIDLDPDYTEARANYAGMLLDRLDVDEANRQLTTVLQREPNNVEAITHLAQVYRLQGTYDKSIEAAQKAIRLAPSTGEPHLWLGDSLRLSNRDQEALAEYEKCLKLTNFDSKLAGQLNYYVLGSLIGLGKRRKASEHDIWKDLRSLTYFGMCDSERKLKNYDDAISFCQKALSYSPDDVFAHYALGNSYLQKAIADQSVAELDPARSHFREVIAINPDIAEAAKSKTQISEIEKGIANYQAALRR